MPLNSATQGAAYLSALGYIRGNPDNADANQIARNIRARFPTSPPTSFLAYLNIVRQAIKASRIGGFMERDPSSAWPGFDHPTVPTTAQDPRGYEYRIVIVADPGDGSEPFRTAVTVSSNRPLSESELATIAQGIFNQQSFERDYRNEVNRVGGSVGVEVIVIGAGRTA